MSKVRSYPLSVEKKPAGGNSDPRIQRSLLTGINMSDHVPNMSR